jgi:mRNA interferase MazF
MQEPSQSEVWLLDLSPARGHEQAGRRPGLVVSVDLFNQGPAGLVVVLPITSRSKRIPFHVKVEPPEGGLKETSFVKCEEVRCVSKDRLLKRWGTVTPVTMSAAKDRLRILLDL